MTAGTGSPGIRSLACQRAPRHLARQWAPGHQALDRLARQWGIGVTRHQVIWLASGHRVIWQGKCGHRVSCHQV
ncbi:unnamed protein product [Staurois parvus]|uniref:Uncharacterized protein n=1 Tax=Staurois parvus TaxID=386267 RepID=A0ABN9FGC4_9NEOB|nr:unnamed protein product [Staurois parvus]